MDITEATKEAVLTGRCITRLDLKSTFGEIKIKPTNTSDCCIIIADGKPSAARWNPKAEDLTADDWIVVH